MSQPELRAGARTDVGRVRGVNEDDYLVAPPVFAVADGMGGHDDGAAASRIVVEELRRLADAGYDAGNVRDRVAATLAECQRRIAEHSVDRIMAGRARGYAGTTVVAALLVDDEDPWWLLVNLGDSRIYHLGDEGLVQVSTDHSVVQELIDAGRISRAEAATHPARNVITRALGGRGEVEPADYFRVPADGRLLLCSDGINAMLDDPAIALVLREEEEPEAAADRLVAAAVAAGGVDNATAVVVDVTDSFASCA